MNGEATTKEIITAFLETYRSALNKDEGCMENKRITERVGKVLYYVVLDKENKLPRFNANQLKSKDPNTTMFMTKMEKYR